MLRQDNADLRLTPLAQKLGLDVQERMNRVQAKQQAYEKIANFVRQTSIAPSEIDQILQAKGSAPLRQKMKLHKILLRPNMGLEDFKQAMPNVRDFLAQFDPEFVEGAEINLKYEGYIRKEQEQVNKMNRLEDVRLYDIDYATIKGLSSEAVEKLNQLQPATIGQASRISGVSPADVSVLLVYVGR